MLFHLQELEAAHKQEKLNLEHLHEKKVSDLSYNAEHLS